MTTTEIPETYLVFNYVTSRLEEREDPPQLGDPNQQVQAELTSAYSGSTSGAQSLSSGTIQTPTVSVLADPSALLTQVAQNSLAVTTQQLEQIQQAVAGLDQLGQIPNMISSMHGHAENILENGTKIFDAIDLTFRPEDAGSPLRCSQISDFIGSVQGTFNDTLKGITNTLGQITNALIKVPQQIIGAFTSVVSGLITAIQTGVSQAINLAINGLTAAGNQLFGALGSTIQGAIKQAGALVTEVQSAIQAEIDNVAAAINDVANNLFRMVVPNVNPCLKDIWEKANPGALSLDVGRLASSAGDSIQGSFS
jgi:hypothetical protein